MPVFVTVIILLLILGLVGFAAGVRKLRIDRGTIEHVSRELLIRLEAMEDRMERNERSLAGSLSGVREELRLSLQEAREEIGRNFFSLGENQAGHLRDISGIQKDALDLLANRLAQLTKENEERQNAIKDALDTRLKELQAGNEEKLERMRILVDEKLHSTLERRLGAAFSNVSEWLDKVHKGLGEMKNLASDVGDLRKVLTNVKTRGTWGEIQLGTLLEQILYKEQYAKNVAVKPDSAEQVEFAVKLPGREKGCPVWLPIDSKFPQEDYLRIVDASERGETEVLLESRKALERRVCEEAKEIREKYISVPHTTDFAILFLPVEGLYSEILRIDGLCERLMRDFRVVVSGPTTVAALLNSLQMGFRTLAVEKRSSEVWTLLGQVKTEFAKFGDILEKVRNRITQAEKELEGAGVRTRAIERKLRNVTEMPSDGIEYEKEIPEPSEDSELL